MTVRSTRIPSISRVSAPRRSGRLPRAAMLLSLVAVCMLAGCGRHAAATATVVPHPPVAIVAGQRISAEDLRNYVDYTAQYYSDPVTLAGQGPPLQCAGADQNWACSVVHRQVLARLLQERVILAYAQSHGIRLDRDDERRINVALNNPTLPHGRSIHFLHDVLERELIIQRVEDSVVPASVKQGPSVHIMKYSLPIVQLLQKHVVYKRALDLATYGSTVPAGTRQREEWEAPFRLPKKARAALDYATVQQFVGPFRYHNTYLVIQLLGRVIHRYG